MGKKKTQKEEKTYKLILTAAQIEHVRDLLSVIINPQSGTTVSEHIARHNKRLRDERDLWDNIVAACERAKVTCGDEAPDYVIAVAPPEVGIIRVEPNSDEQTADGEQSENGRQIFSIDGE